MTAAGVPSNSITYTCLIEAAVLSGDVDMAQRVFARAMAAGVTNSVQVRLSYAASGTRERFLPQIPNFFVTLYCAAWHSMAVGCVAEAQAGGMHVLM
jgi:pentatricopeptide repeat protein